MAHFEPALAATLEIVARMSILVVIGRLFDPNVEVILFISASTSAAALIILVFRLNRLIKPLLVGLSKSPVGARDATFAPERALRFAWANYASTMTYLISSPPLIRIVAAAGLDVIGLAAFSFAQGLYISLQRAFPGLLILPTLEPIVMSQLVGNIRDGKVTAALSLLFKGELVCILTVVILTTIAGESIVAILSRPTYAPYYFVIPVLASSLIITTSYRLFELIANTNFKQHIFLWLWPLSLFTMIAMYMTINTWGFASILFWPIAENCLRIGILSYRLRGYAVWRAFDPRRSAFIIFSAASIIVFGLLARWIVNLDFQHSDLIFAAFALICFAASLFIFPPLRMQEHEMLLTALPLSLNFFRRISSMLTR